MFLDEYSSKGILFPLISEEKGKLIIRISEGRGHLLGSSLQFPKAMFSKPFQIIRSGVSFFSKAYRVRAIREKFGISFSTVASKSQENLIIGA